MIQLMITMEHVSKKYENNVLALNDINVTIYKGEFVFVVGQSVAGKSNFMRMLLRETLPSSGTVKVNGDTIYTMRKKDEPYLHRSLRIGFQYYRLLTNKTGY